MHTVALQLAPVLAAEKSKVPFYIAGGALVLWALILALVLGMRKPEFPGSLRGQRIVMAVSIVLVLGAVSTAVITSGPPAKTAEASTGAQTTSTSSTAPPATTTTPTTPSNIKQRVTKLAIEALPSGQLAYSTQVLSAGSGQVSITMTNGSPLEHNFTLAQGSTVLGATPTFKGGSRTLTLNLKPGTYKFFCTVPGHRAAGMEGTLTVS